MWVQEDLHPAVTGKMDIKNLRLIMSDNRRNSWDQEKSTRNCTFYSDVASFRAVKVHWVILKLRHSFQKCFGTWLPSCYGLESEVGKVILNSSFEKLLYLGCFFLEFKRVAKIKSLQSSLRQNLTLNLLLKELSTFCYLEGERRLGELS